MGIMAMEAGQAPMARMNHQISREILARLFAVA
jgi:hypothetical protein